ncbi:hypothetical protein L208DRAFT_510887 [Tricholoma matsutake]|nr:hypothetical protein L208DRAFT_510887 [Tricholoma matsutake 945]
MKDIREWLHLQLPLGPPSFQKHGVLNSATDAELALSSRSESQAYINRLSVEILADIFVRCLPFAGYDPFLIPNANHAPLLLCQICGYWRQVAISTPKLWASISINSATVHRSLVSLWLSRSQPSPLSFQISSSFSPFGKKSAKAIFAMFLSNIDRWQDVHLKLDKTFCKMVLMIPPEKLSTARHLGLDARGCTKEQRAQLLTITRLFPNLRRLIFFAPFSHYSNSIPISTIDLPCSQLTHIRLTGGLSMYQCSEILLNCKQAVDCQLSGIYGTSEPVTLRDTLLPHLKSLKLDSVADTCDLGQLLGQLICPVIRTLSINQGKWRLPASGSRALNKFLAHSQRGLHEFRLSDCNVSEMDVLQCLRMPSLQSIHTLYISISTITNQTLNFLQRRGYSNYDTFPFLQKLSLKYCHTSDGALINMVASRRRSPYAYPATRILGTMLQFIHVTFRLPMTIDQLTSQTKKEMENEVRRAHKRDIARLQTLQEEGLQVSWSTKVWA